MTRSVSRSGLLLLALTLVSLRPAFAQEQTDSTAEESADTAVAITKPSRPARSCWTCDRRDWAQGDLLRIAITERTSATGRSAKDGSYGRSTGASLGASADLATKLPLSKASMDTRYATGNNESANVTRSEALIADMSVKVSEVLPRGVLRIEGSKEVSVDGHKQKLRLSGLVRAEDVRADGTVPSSRIADASISYAGKQPMMRPGFVGRLLRWLWP